MPLLTGLARACAVAWLFIIGLAVFWIGGCSWEMLTRQFPDTRIVLQKGQRMDFNIMTRKNAQGQRVEEYRCEVPPMVCEGYAINMECRCDF